MNYSKILFAFCGFLLIHSFYLIPPVNSTFLVPIILIFSFLLKQDINLVGISREVTFNIVSLYLFIIIFLILSALLTVFHAVLDFTYLKNFLSQLIQFTIILLFVYLFVSCSNSVKDALSGLQRLIINVFIVQSIIQLLAFVSSEFASFIHVFYKKEVILHLYDGYSGARGLALTGAPGWGVSVGYAVAFMFYVKEYLIESREYSLKSVVIALLLIAGMFFSGRSAFLGVIVGGVYFLFCARNGRVKFIFKSLFIVGVVVLASILIFPDLIKLLYTKSFPFVFEFVFKYQNSGTFETGSTNRLLQMWQVPITYSELLFGTGRLESEQGGYYLGTDVGYLRNILYGGLIWMFLMFLFFLVFSGAFYSWIKQDKDAIFYFFVVVLALVFEAKAMTVGYNKYIFTILLVYFIGKIIVKNQFRYTVVK